MNTDITRTIRLPLVYPGTSAIAKAPLALPTLALERTIAFVAPTVDYPLSQIPKGPNPRYLDATSRLSKAICDAYGTDPIFGVKSGGVHLIYDDESLNVVEEGGAWYIEFACSAEYTGHYDGQHTMAAVDQAVGDTSRPVEHKQHLMISLVPRSTFADIGDIREAAKAVNCRRAQKATSELDIAGVFNNLKNNINYCPTQDVMWAQHQVDTNGKKIRSERSVTQIVSMLASVAPLTHTKTIGEIARFPKMGEGALKSLRHDDWSTVFDAAIPHVDVLLELADYIRENTRTVLGDTFDTCALVRMTSKGELNNPTVSERKPFRCELFDGGRSVEYGLPKDLLPMLCYALAKVSYNHYDETTNRLVPRLTVAELKALWLTCGKEVLRIVNHRFGRDFTSRFKSRWSDFVLDTTMWSQAETVVQTAYYDGEWKNLLNIELHPAA